MFKRLWLFFNCIAISATAFAQVSENPLPASGKKATKTVKQGICLVADFRNLALTVHDPKLRQDLVLEWLKNHTDTCSIDQLNMINRYRAVWLGTSDNPKVAGIIDSLIELKSGGDPQKLQEIFSPQINAAAVSDSVVATAKPTPSAVVYQLFTPPQMGSNNGADAMPSPPYGSLPSPSSTPIAPQSPSSMPSLKP